MLQSSQIAHLLAAILVLLCVILRNSEATFLGGYGYRRMGFYGYPWMGMGYPYYGYGWHYSPYYIPFGGYYG